MPLTHTVDHSLSLSSSLAQNSSQVPVAEGGGGGGAEACTWVGYENVPWMTKGARAVMMMLKPSFLKPLNVSQLHAPQQE